MSIKNEILILPDGSEIRVEHDGESSFTTWDGGAMWETGDEELMKELERHVKTGEEPGDVLKRAIEHVKVHGFRLRTEWEKRDRMDPDAWKHNDDGED